MDNPFRLIVVTEPGIMPGEGELIAWMLHRGIDRVHIRKPGSSEGDVRDLLADISADLHTRLSLHGYQQLALEFGTGIHLNAANPTAPEGFKGTLSRSCHSITELQLPGTDYNFLSPIFNSISKEGYSAAFNIDTLAVPPATIALGGVTPQHFATLRSRGFQGAAMLGYVWVSHNPQIIKQQIDAAIYHSRY